MSESVQTGWTRLKLPYICERLIGFSVSHDRKVLVVSYEGMHMLNLDPEVVVETDRSVREYDQYDPDTGLAIWKDDAYRVMGLFDGEPLLESPLGESLRLDTEAEQLTIVSASEDAFVMPYRNFSGDWAVATFSPDGNFVVLGCPYGFDFVVLRRD